MSLKIGDDEVDKNVTTLQVKKKINQGFKAEKLFEIARK